MKKDRPFAKESELCAAFLALLPENWTPYAETAGWDILLVRKADGAQIGIEAKLRLNAEVLSQALEEWCFGESPGPDYRAVLVPYDDAGGFYRIADYVGVTVIRVGRDVPGRRDVPRFCFEPKLPSGKREDGWQERGWHEWSPVNRHKLPEYVPDVAAGASAPLQLTEWKIGALKIAYILERRGYVTRDDFRSVGIDHRRWMAPWPGWLVSDERGWVRGSMPDFKAQHPIVFEKIAADAERWYKERPGDPSLFGAAA